MMQSGRLKNNISLFLLALPGVILVIVFSYLPMFGVILAFKKFNIFKGVFGSAWNGLENFKFLFSTSDAWVIARNTILYNAGFIVIGTVSCVLLAVVLDLIRSKRLAKISQTVMIVPNFLSMVIMSYMVYAFLSPELGIVNNLLKAFGPEGINWYTEPRWWPLILNVVSIWKGVGFGSIIYLSTISGISKELYEAAVIDGASKLKQIRYITIPHLVPIIVIMLIMSVGKIFNSDFGLFYVVTRNQGPLYSTTLVIDTYIYNALMGGGTIGQAAAAAFFQSVIGFVLVLLTNYTVKKLDSESSLF